MTEKKKKDKGGKRLKSIIPTFRLEADGRGNYLTVTFVGVLSVKAFSASEITLATKRESFVLMGKSLEMTVFENKTVTVYGVFECIKFLDKKSEGRM